MLNMKEVANLLNDGKLIAVDMVTDLLARIHDGENQSIFIKVTAERALAEALASDERRANGQALGPWDGVPIAWKDLFDTKGDTTTAGSRVYSDAEPAEQDAPVVAACRQQGLISLGKTNLSDHGSSCS